ncbi:tryptophan dimethylallyltransferase family protein [Streptomyces sp. NPDC039016]|uniref:tryptophan dimethylallyltransferase family protein n=1 Tax=Streptomyces sp. NPDC039016 TaxID=3154330 RepID=UPI0033CFD452
MGGLVSRLGAGMPHSVVEAVFDAMTEPWGRLPVSQLEYSDVSPDGSPLEFAVDLSSREAVIQIAVEPMATQLGQSFADRSSAAHEAVERLEAAFGVPTDQWEAIADVLLPRDGGQGHALMLGAELRASAPPSFKVWLYPGVLGTDRAPEVVFEALSRLGLQSSCSALARHAARGFDTDMPILFSLDLTTEREPRTKVYFRHYDCGPDMLARHLSIYPGFHSDRVSALGHALEGTGSMAGEQPPVTCLAFRRSRGPDPIGVTAYVPLWTCPAHDGEIRSRVAASLMAEGVRTGRYEAALHEVTARHLDTGRGIHNYISWQPGSGRPRMKVYFSPELRGLNPPLRYDRSHPDTDQKVESHG